MSDVRDLASSLVQTAVGSGADHAEALIEDGHELELRVHDGTLDFLKEARTRGAGLRVFVDGRPGFAYTSDAHTRSFRDLAERAVRLARLCPPDEHAGLPEPGWLARQEEMADLDLYDPTVPELSAEECLALSVAMEKAALGVDPKIRRTQGCGTSRFSGTTALANTHGAVLACESTSVGFYVVALADDEGTKQQGWGEGGTWRHRADAWDVELLGRLAGEGALRRLGPRRVATQEVPVVMHPDVVEGWLGRVVGAFSGEEVLKKNSYLHDKMDQPIASSLVTLIDEGCRRRGMGSEPFDGEGVPTRRTPLLEQGVCRNFLYDAYTARKSKRLPTGAAERRYSGTPAIGYHNLFLEPGTTSADQMFEGIEQGFYYTDSGSFGYNPTTGDYSFQAAGFWIDQGAIAYPVDEVTVASTTLDMLRQVDRVGREIEWRGRIACPALRIASMTVSG